MNIPKGILVELRERRLWPVALVLLAGLIAVPLLLTKSPASTTPGPTMGALPGTAAHGISVRLASTGGQPRLQGPGRDPFTQQAGSASSPLTGAAPLSGGTAVASGAAAGIASVSAGGGSAGGASSGGSSSGRSAGGSSAPSGGGSSATSAPTPSPAPARPAARRSPSGLTSTESYSVAIQISNSSGGLNLIDPVQRLSPLPSQSQPLLVELGALQGGQRVLFAVMPGTVVSGPGACTPGPIDCEVLSLAPNQSESLSLQNGTVVAEFAVTGISAQHYPSVAAANAARNAANPVGNNLVANAALPALSLFQYEPSVGAVVDLRNLTIGGN